MEVTPVRTGVVRPKRVDRGLRRYFPGGWSDSTVPVRCFLVDHPAGRLLFDTGQTARAAEPGYFPRWHPFMKLARFELGPQDEAAAQVDPSSLRWVVLSHLHTDHAGGVAGFQGVEVLVSRVEWALSRGFGGKLRGYLPQHWPEGLEPTLVDFEDPPVGPFHASHELTPDASLALVPTPGHTPGHMGLLARSRGSGSGRGWLLGGDMPLTPEVQTWCDANEVTILRAHG